MRFLDDMASKEGFSGGDAIPVGIELYREVYVRYLNRLALAMGSEVRAYSYDRSGCHNWCLLLFAPVGETAVFSETELALGKPGDDLAQLSSVHPDELMELAIESARDADLDACVGVVVSIREEELAFALGTVGDIAVKLLAEAGSDEEE